MATPQVMVDGNGNPISLAGSLVAHQTQGASITTFQSSQLVLFFPNYTNFFFKCTYHDANINAVIAAAGTYPGATLNAVDQTASVPDWWLGEIAIVGSDYGWPRTIVIQLWGESRSPDPQPTTSKCTAPTSVWLTDVVVMEGSTTLNWSGAGNGTGSSSYAISSYTVQYRDVDANGQAGEWTTYGSVPVASGTTSGSCTVYPPSSSGYYRQFRVKATCLDSYYDSDFSTEPYPALYSNPFPTTPTNPQISPTLFESGDISLSWTPSEDTTNRVAGYNLQARTRSSSSASWGEWQDVTAQIDIGEQTVSTVCSPTLDRGSQIQYRVCAYDDYNAYGAYAVFPEVTRNSAPTTPTGLAASPTLWESGQISLTWTASTDVDGNLDHYLVQYQISDDGTTWGEVTSDTTVTASYSMTPTSSLARGGYLRFKISAIDALGAASGEATVTVRRNQIPTKPTSLSVSPLIFETGYITLSWHASSDPDGSVDHYDLQYRTKTQTGSYGSWTSDGTTTETSITKSPQLSRGSYIQYRVRSVDNLGATSAYVSFTEVQRNTQMDSPTNPSVTPALFESGSVTFTWGAPAGDKPLDHYEVAYATSSNHTTWSSPVTLVSSTTDTSYTVAVSTFGVGRGQYVRLMVRAFDSYGVESDWATAETRKNSAPKAPISLSFIPSNTDVFESMPVRVSFPAGTDVDGNLASYDIALMVANTEADVLALTPAAGDIVATPSAHAGDVTITADISRTTNRGQYIRAAVRSVDALGVKSGWTYTPNAMEHNILPNPPVIMFPGDDDPPPVSLSKDPIFGIFPVSGSELKTLTYEVKITQGSTTVCDWKQVLVDYPGAPAVIRGFRCGVNLSPGNYSIKPRVSDGIGSPVEGNPVAFTVEAPSWGRVIQSGSIISSNGFYTDRGVLIMPEGTTVTNEIMDTTEDVVVTDEVMSMTSSISHQEDLRELLQVVNARRAWFSLAGIQYSTEVGYFANWLPQMQQLCIALSMCYWNADEPGMDIPIMPGSNYPRADIINAIRALAENL